MTTQLTNPLFSVAMESWLDWLSMLGNEHDLMQHVQSIFQGQDGKSFEGLYPLLAKFLEVELQGL